MRASWIVGLLFADHDVIDERHQAAGDAARGVELSIYYDAGLRVPGAPA